MKRFTFTLILAMMLAFTAAHAQIDAVDTENQNFTFSFAGQNENSMTALTAVQPLKPINGHAAMFVGRQTANDEVVSENIDVEVAGQYKFLEGFIEGKRDVHRGIDWQSTVGYFLTPGSTKVGPFTITGGAGNSTANTQVKDALGIKDQNPVQFNWVGYLQVDFWKIKNTLTAEPELNFDSVELELENAITHKVDKNVSIGAKVTTHFASNPPTGDKTHSQYLLFATWTR